MDLVKTGFPNCGLVVDKQRKRLMHLLSYLQDSCIVLSVTTLP